MRWSLPIVTGLAVLGLGWLAATHRLEGSNVAIWWPAAGVAVAAYAVAWRRGERVAVPVAVGLGVLGAELLAGYPLLVSLGFALANLANPLLTVPLLSRRTATLRLRDTLDYACFCGAAFVGALVTAAVASITVLVVGDGDPWGVLGAVVPSHLSAVLCIAPVALLVPGRSAPAGRVETALQVAGTLLVTAFVFAPAQQVPLGFLCIGFLIWGGARVAPTWLYLQVVLLAVVAAVATTAEWGAFAATARAYKLAPETATMMLDIMLVAVPLAVYPLALARDVHRAALAEVRESRELLDSVLAGATGTAIIGADLGGAVTSWNAGAERILGWSAEDACGRTLGTVLAGGAAGPSGQGSGQALDAELDAELADVVATLVAGTAWVDRDWDVDTRDGARITLALRLTARRTADGTVVGWIAVGEDVTEQRRTEAALRDALDRQQQAVQRLEELDAVKTSFVQSVSHELRTPLTSVLGYTDMLVGEQLGPLNPQQGKMLTAVSRNGRRLLTLIEDLLTLSRIEQRAFTTDPTRLDLRSAVRRGCEAVALQAEAASVALDVDLGADEVPVIGDPEQLERVALNLVGNAVKFSPAGGVVTLTVRCEDGEAVLAVTDRGTGIPEAEVARLFERFFRSSSAQRAEVQGSGLGLAIVKEVVDHHDGRVEVESQEGVGTTVRVRLPLQAPTAATQAATPVDPARSAVRSSA